MAFVTLTKSGRFEIRESRSTPAGPRSRTLASFKELDEKAIERASARAEAPLDPEQLRRAALRAGAPVAPSGVDRAARDLLGRLARGEKVNPMLERLLLDALQSSKVGAVSDSARAASEWVDASVEERGEALADLLRLADAVPLRERPRASSFPRLRSGAA
ncbi:MAG: hypothetical protein ABW065_09465 [Solirubrobacterales bacterium]